MKALAFLKRYSSNPSVGGTRWSRERLKATPQPFGLGGAALDLNWNPKPIEVGGLTNSLNHDERVVNTADNEISGVPRCGEGCGDTQNA
jgi:hypothetical protein